MDNSEALAMYAFAAAGIVMMALNPRRAACGWYSDHCSCTNDWARDPNCAVHGGKR